MKVRMRAVWGFATAVCLVLLCATHAGAQTVTTGTITGTVTDTQGGVLPGATVTAVHTDTGTNYEAVTGADGRYTILNVRVGGYTVSANMSGFKDQKQDKVTVQLGAEQTADFKLALASVSETVDVVANTPLIDLGRAGTADNIPNAVKESLPTISRSLTDIVRISPMFNTFGGGSGADSGSVVSVAGSSYRYNSIQIDGAINNDLFGLASSAGVPGGTAETQPVSLDAIQEIQLVVSPYDIRQGGFAGGGINAVTKSGTNSLHGTAFFFGRNEDWVGKGVSNTKISTFKDKQGGGSLGGPIMKNKVFFFGTLDDQRKERPVGFSVGSTGQQFREPALFARYIADLKTLYGYDPAAGGDPGGEFPRETNNNKYFVRGDFNVARGHQLTVRNNYIDALNDIGTPSVTFFKTPDNYYRYVSKTNSTVAQLNSQVGHGVNELRFTYTRVRDHRESPIGGSPFPQTTVTLATGVSVQSGTEQFSAKNSIDQDIVELNDAYTLVKGKHTLTLGTHNEFLDLSNLFIRDNFGTYTFTSIDNFEKGLAQSYNYSFSATSDPNQPAAFKVRQLGFYAGDSWRTPSEHDGDLRHSRRRAELPGQAQRESRVGRQLRVRHRRRPEPGPVLAPRRRQLRHQRQGHAPDPRRRGPVQRPSVVCVAVEPVRQHRHRLHAHRRGQQQRQHHSLHHRRAPPADHGDRRGRRIVLERDRHDRSRLQVPRGAARQRRLRPHPAAAGSTAPPTSSGRRRSRTSSTRTSTSCRCRARPASAAGRSSRARSRR